MLDWVYPYPVKMTHLPGQVSVAYIDEGAGPQTLVFLHGLGSYLKGWTKNVARTEPGFPLHCPRFSGLRQEQQRKSALQHDLFCAHCA
jgi:pimeloyl-ACP methyl ester carboxylesterase